MQQFSRKLQGIEVNLLDRVTFIYLNRFGLLALILFSFGVAQNVITRIDSTEGGRVGTSSSLALSADGLPVISYRDELSNGDLKVVKCGDAYCRTGNVISRVDTAGNVGRHTSIAVPLDGRPVISYYDVGNGDLKVAKCGNPSCSAGNVFTSLDTIGNVGLGTSVKVPSDGLPVVAYHDGTRGDLKVLKCGNASCTVGNTVNSVDTAGYVGLYFSLALSLDGLPVIAYNVVHPGNRFSLKILKCGNAACSSGNSIVKIDSSSSLILAVSIGVPSDGLPVVSFPRSLNPGGGLNILKCGNATCTGGNTFAVADTVGTQSYTSVGFATDGLPIITYWDYNRPDLRVVKCGNAACSIGNVISVLDTVGRVGLYNFIVVPADGLPVISYFLSSLTPGGLRVLKCARPDCGDTPVPIGQRQALQPDPFSIFSLNGTLVIALNETETHIVQIFTLTGQKLFSARISGPQSLAVPGPFRGIHVVRVVSSQGIWSRKFGSF